MTPKKQIGKFVSPERPYRIIYHIMASTGGRAIEDLAKNSADEEEILFLPGTELEVLGLRLEKKDEMYKEVYARVYPV